MIVDLLERYDFRGWDSEMVIELLGDPDANLNEVGYSDWDFGYEIGLERSGPFSLDLEFLIFRLDTNGKVIDYRCVVD